MLLGIYAYPTVLKPVLESKILMFRHPYKFRHFIMKQAQVTGGWAMPSGTLGSPVWTPRARSLTSSSTLHKNGKNTVFRNNYVRIFLSNLFPTLPYINHFLSNLRDSDSPTLKLSWDCPASTAIVSHV